MAFQYPTVDEFKAYFNRGFPYQPPVVPPDVPNPDEYIQDSDIAKAFVQANMNINQGLFRDQALFSMCYMYLAAHYLVIDMQMAATGINGVYTWVEQSKSVGSVSQSFAIPQQILNDPYMSMLTKTKYGAKYVEMILPMTRGAMYISRGSTRP